MADIEEVNYPSGGRRADSPVDIESRNEREGSRESDHDDRDRRRRGGGYERDLRRENRRYAPYPSQDERSGRRQSGSSGKECRVYVWNLPYNVKWQDLKDFMKTVGEVGHVDIIEDGHGKSKGCGIVEFRHKEDAEKAIKELHGTDFRGRSIHIREDRIEETQSERRRPTSSRGTDSGNYGSNHSPQIGGGGLGNLTNLLGMGNLNVAQGLNYKTDPLSCTVFVSNLDYNVNWQKLKDTFRVAGNVIRADINLDSDHKSKGFGTVQFETATEAISAVSMFHGQNLSGRAMSVRLDRNAPIMQQLSNAGMNNVNMGRTAASGAMNQVAVLQLLQSLQGLSQLAQLTSNLNNAGGGLGAALGSLTGGGGIAGLGATPGMADPSATNPLAALSGLGMLGNNLGLGGAGGGGGGSLGVGGGLGSLSQGDSGAPGKQVFVRNLPWRYTWQDLKDKFKGAGRVVRADIMTESGGRSKGCGTVMFETAEDAAHAISLFNGALIDGREIDVRMDRLG
ncbi:myelin expression factor 2-like [Montipora capricornis]|uniref:myelin expression factor 2-like n=1 Tax=Montipora capricornis TaxID=246305 RepID=UPI0035F1405A